MAIGATGSDAQVFGAQVVTQTLQNLNSGGKGGMSTMGGGSGLSTMIAGNSGTSGTSGTFGAQVVTKTIQNMNTSPMGGVGSDFDFQTSVLGAPVEAVGTIIDDLV
ncbi:MAG: hypothetical protein AB7E47_17385 [Desulfovibrionaceae bacterium]